MMQPRYISTISPAYTLNHITTCGGWVLGVMAGFDSNFSFPSQYSHSEISPSLPNVAPWRRKAQHM